MKFEWDRGKAAANLKKHGITFQESATVFGDPLATTHNDPDHSYDEQRFITFGMSLSGRLIMVSHADRGDVVRIISARLMTAKEKEFYEED